MSYAVTYRIVETLDPRRPGKRWFEVWSENRATGYQWKVGEYETRKRAAALIKHWEESPA